MIMPFGKWRGYALRDIPTDYLLWLQQIDLKPLLRQSVIEELERRSGRQDEPQRADISLSVVNQWYRKASIRFHPDREGGNTRAMQVVNACRDLLLEVLEGAL